MPEYQIGFAKKLAETGASIVEEGLESEESKRTVLYLSLVACEIALKAALERATIHPRSIRKKSHNLSSLLKAVSACTILSEVTRNKMKRVPATEIRGIVVDDRFGDATVGHLLEGEKYGVSKFPNEIRYGDTITHFPASVMSKLSNKVLAWVVLHWDDIQKA